MYVYGYGKFCLCQGPEYFPVPVFTGLMLFVCVPILFDLCSYIDACIGPAPDHHQEQLLGKL